MARVVLENELLPCLQTFHQNMQIEDYRDLVALSMAVVQKDAAQLRGSGLAPVGWVQPLGVT